MSTQVQTVTAYRNGESREFTAEVWKQLPENKYGWELAAEEPDEVKSLKGSTGIVDKIGKGIQEPDSNLPPVIDEPVKLNAAELAEKIYAAETVEAVEALVPEGETRKTVLAAAEAQKALLAAKD